MSCPICGKNTTSDSPHRCDPKVLKRIDAGKKGAESRQWDESMKSYGQKLSDGFRMMKGTY